MNIKVNFKRQTNDKSNANLILFVDEKFNIIGLKKHIPYSEYSYISDLLNKKDTKKKIITFEISSKKKIILVSLKKDLANSGAENLGAKCYDILNELKETQYRVNADTIPNALKNIIGYFLHGIKLKSYKFEKYKTKKNKGNIFINVIGKNIPNQKDQLKFSSIEEGTFYTRDLVSEPGNVLHPDEYAKRIKTLSKLGLKIKIFNDK